MERQQALIGAVLLSIVTLCAGYLKYADSPHGTSTIASAATSALQSQPLCQAQNEEVLFVSCGGFY